MSIRRVCGVGLVVVAVCLSVPLPAYAYLDPGTGSYVVQLLIGAVVGAGFLIKANWAKLKSFFTKGREPTRSDD